MERRVLLAIFLAFLVLYAYQAFLVPPVPPQQQVVPSGGGTTAPATNTAPATSETSPAPPPAAAPVSSATPLIAATAEQDVRIETPAVLAIFTNRGARLKSWRLKDYRDGRGEPLELVANDLGESFPLPFSLSLAGNAAASTTLNSALYSIRGAPDAKAVHDSAVEVLFEYSDSSGLSSVKRFRIEPRAYTVAFEATVMQNGQLSAPAVLWGPGMGNGAAQDVQSIVKPRGLFSVGGDVSRLDASDIGEQPTYDQDFEYAGIDDHYFAAIALKPARAKVTYQPVSIPAPTGAGTPARELMAFSLEAPARGALSFYIGPKDFETLAAIDRNLVRSIDFGMFSVLVVPLLRSLNWINDYVGNYGWAILILTVFINIILFPLNHKSVVSMRKMQEIQPEAKAIQERYSKLKATDPARQKMNQELMALSRSRGANPASGCVPAILMLPVFLAFYALLTTAIELRGAPFVGWMNDLSQPDPFYVMPVLVGLSQLVTQWMTPQTGIDPTQQKIMLIMPLVLIFVFVSTPVGALIYWLVGNIWRVGQQYLTNYLIGPPNVRTIRPAAERRVKRVGSGKTESAAREN